MSEHTKGPWRVSNHDDNDDIVVRSGPKIVANCESDNYYDLPAEKILANARLIAAAPELLAACKAMVTDFDLGEPSIKHSLKLMEVAIAKAIE